MRLVPDAFLGKPNSIIVFGDDNLSKTFKSKPKLRLNQPKDAQYLEDTDELPGVPISVILTTYLSYAILLLVGHIRDFLGKIFKSHEYQQYKHTNGYAPIISGFESLYHRRLYKRIRCC